MTLTIQNDRVGIKEIFDIIEFGYNADSAYLYYIDKNNIYYELKDIYLLDNQTQLNVR